MSIWYNYGCLLSAAMPLSRTSCNACPLHASSTPNSQPSSLRSAHKIGSSSSAFAHSSTLIYDLSFSYPKGAARTKNDPNFRKFRFEEYEATVRQTTRWFAFDKRLEPLKQLNKMIIFSRETKGLCFISRCQRPAKRQPQTCL
mgnify:CR=1 FL=1